MLYCKALLGEYIYQIQDLKMGSSSSEISESDFTQHWRVAHTVDNLTVWENRDDPHHQLEQYYVRDAEDDHTRRLLSLRRHSPYLVGAYTLAHDGMGCCTDRQGTKIFVERIPLRLSNIEDIPFPDVLHLLDHCLQGFKVLSGVVGFFRVDEDQVGVNQRGQVKVWLSTAFEGSQLVGNRNVPEQEMLQDILGLVFQAEDVESYPPNVPPLSQALSVPQRSSTFDSTIQEFKDYAKKYTESFVPGNLQCVHSAGGANLINDWCRNNRSYGFDQNSLRISERVYQSKTGRLVLEGEAKPNEFQVIDNQLASALEARVNNQQPLMSITSAVQQQEQLRQDLPQLHHRVIQPQLGSQALPPRIGIPQQVVIQSQPIQPVPPQQQVFVQQVPQQIQPQVSQQIYIPQQQIIRQEPPVVPQQIFVQSQVAAPQQQQFHPIGQQAVPQQVVLSRQAVPFNTQPSTKALQREPSRKEIISQVFQQNDSRLQQQRVISQTIEIKDNSKVSETNALQTASTTTPSYNTNTPSYSYQAQQAPSKDLPKTEPAEQLRSYARAVPYSVNVPEERFTASEDGKSSAEFLALLSQLKGGQSSNYEVYSQAADTPSYVKANPSEGSPKQYFSYLPQETNYDQDYSSSPQETYKYKASEYVGSIDPELQADLVRYQQS